MTLTVHTSSATTVYLHGGQQQPRFFSLTANESTRKAMQTSQDLGPSPVRAVSAFDQATSSISSTTGPSSPPTSWPAPTWPASTLPPLAPSLQPRLRMERSPETGSALSPLSQRSRQSTAVQSPETQGFSSRRPSYENSPFGGSRGETRDRQQNYDWSIGNSVRHVPYSTASPSNLGARGLSNLGARGPSDSSARSANPRRFHLHIRQQPRAARAGPDGKDRRAIDPPPIVQLLVDDFNPDSPEDLAEIQSTFWVVHCRLVAAFAPETDVSTQSHFTEDGRREVQRLLLGTTVASPHQTSDDPDPPSMRPHPITKPPSPTTTAFPILNRSPRLPHEIPGAFFIFADVSVRKAGEYRLQFTLMKMEPALLMQGSTVPAIDVVTSDRFRAVNAKDFDQVHPSTPLVIGLLNRGAPFPLKLKKGTREGQRKRRQRSEEDSDEDESEDHGTSHF
ncbi:hypothetical protein H2200_006648 [Cladophialophora chaetospira]|uniref:Velvet domain-containing protein n=1 Tax=Cladophialophora chaetospira TaxID=386627 RepID=A0AA39CHE4_9EURO|nr:hypothetical protein H2200_006648 [Cladophialophora chaetospira]